MKLGIDEICKLLIETRNTSQRYEKDLTQWIESVADCNSKCNSQHLTSSC